MKPFEKTTAVVIIAAQLCLSFYFGASTVAATLNDDDKALKSQVTAPANMSEVSDTLGGSYFADKALVEESEHLQSQLTILKEKIRGGKITSAEALAQLDEIQTAIQMVRTKIEKSKVLVEAFKVFTRKDEQIFPLGESRRVIITGDRIRLRRWEGPGIKCVLEKSIVAKEKPPASEFGKIKMKHELGSAEPIVGISLEERQQTERDYLASEDGQKLTPAARTFRKQLTEQSLAAAAKYSPFHDQECNMLDLNGLSWKEGNKNLSLVIESKGGGKFHRSQWQRHAVLTVYLPTCEWVALRGCECGVDISGLTTNLLLTNDGSRDKDYVGRFEVQDHQGDVNVDQVPIRKLVNIKGDVNFTATDEFVNSGTSYRDNTRTTRSFDTADTEIKDIQGALSCWFLRTNLAIDNVTGKLDVRNEFGDTQLTLNGDASAELDPLLAHRVISESGSIVLTATQGQLSKLKTYAFTNCGVLDTNVSRELLEFKSFSTGQPKRSWHGLVPKLNQRHMGMPDFERPDNAWGDKQRAAGLDLISRSGSIEIKLDGNEH